MPSEKDTTDRLLRILKAEGLTGAGRQEYLTVNYPALKGMSDSQVRARVAQDRADLIRSGAIEGEVTEKTIESGDATDEELDAAKTSDDPDVQAKLEAALQVNGQLTAALENLSGGAPVDVEEVISKLLEMNPHLDMSQGAQSLMVHLANDRTAPLVQAAVAATTEGTIGGWVPVQTGVRSVMDAAGQRRTEATFTHIKGEEFTAAVSRYSSMSGEIGRAVAMGRKSGIDWRVLIAVADGEAAANQSRVRSEDPATAKLNKAIDGGLIPEFYRPKTKGPAGTGMQMREGPTGRLQEINRDLSERAAKFNGSLELALLSRKDEGLASAIFERGYASVTEADRAQQIMGNDYVDLLEMGTPLSGAKIQAILGTDPYGGAGGGGTVNATLPDPAAVKNSVTDLFRAWFQREPVEGESEQFLGAVNSAIMGEARARTSKGKAGNIFKGIDPVEGVDGVATVTDVDPQARLLEFARANPDYKRLFKERPMGMDESEYAGQFQAAAGSFLGAQAPPSGAIRAGMESGSIQTTLGASLATEAAQESSTLLGRLARASQLINGET